MRELVGRGRETDRLRAFLEGLGGGPSVLLIEGEPGIGKTALWDAAVAGATVEAAPSRGRRVGGGEAQHRSL
jgi:predicted ATPase